MSIVLEQLTKRYAGHLVVNNVSLEISDGEFFVLLGPSGSGKSTILRMIAGLAAIDQGHVLLHNQDVTNLLPQERGTGFVFQHYALFRHMSVADNVEFALRIRKVSAADRRRRRDELLELVGLAGLGSRKPHQLSGGQQQRVALARALAHQPGVLLLDEPFGALDAKIRTELRRTLKHVQREIGTTTIFVTHDQEEAFELADRLGVMNAGRLLEVGPPEELYQRPQTEFVATFLGTANLLVGEADTAGVRLGSVHFPLETQPSSGSTPQRVQVLFRPEDVALAPTPGALTVPTLGEATVEQSTFVGSFERLRLRLPALPGVRAIAPPVPFGSGSILVEATRSQDQARPFPLSVGDTAFIGIERVHALIHPGLRFVIATDGSSSAQAALEFGGQLANLAHARTTVLSYAEVGRPTDEQLQAAKEQLGSGLPALDTRAVSEPLALAVRHEVERQPCDLVIVGAPSNDRIEVAEQYLQMGEYHLLLAPSAQLPSRLLICLSPGEPGKEDVLFVGRLARHLGAEVTLLSVIAEANPHPHVREQRERFLNAGVRTLGVLGVPARTLVRSGVVRDQIIDEMATGGHDLLVLGTPLDQQDRRTVLAGVVADIVVRATNYPVLIIRSGYIRSAPWLAGNDRVITVEEVIR
jgi:sulfate/thiosulfate transport system ATP-binding protein